MRLATEQNRFRHTEIKFCLHWNCSTSNYRIQQEIEDANINSLTLSQIKTDSGIFAENSVDMGVNVEYQYRC